MKNTLGDAAIPFDADDDADPMPPSLDELPGVNAGSTFTLTPEEAREEARMPFTAAAAVEFDAAEAAAAAVAATMGGEVSILSLG